MKSIVSIFFLLMTLNGLAQNQFNISSIEAENILIGAYEPAAYLLDAGTVDPKELGQQLDNIITSEQVSKTQSTLAALDDNQIADWIHAQFTNFATLNDSRLKPFFFEYTDSEDSMLEHKIAGAILPGRHNKIKDLVVIEALPTSAMNDEYNSRAAAVVVEMARVIAATDFDTNLVFLASNSDEGTASAYNAFEKYAASKNISIGTKFNYDIIEKWGDRFSSIYGGYRGCR